MSLIETNSAILHDIAARGVDLNVLRAVDFSHLLPDQSSAEAFVAEAQRQGYVVRVIELWEELDAWDVTVQTTIVPAAEAITRNEEALAELASRFGGRADGWGFESSPGLPH